MTTQKEDPVTIEVNLPKTNQTGKNEWADVEDNDLALKAGIKEAGDQIDAISGVTWYTPKVIATEQSRESASFGTLATADEIKSVVVPENGLILIGYSALWKSSALEGRAAIFLGANQLKSPVASGAPAVQETGSPGTSFDWLATTSVGVSSSAGAGEATTVTTGLTVGTSASSGGLCAVFAAAGTYNVGIQFKAISGSVTAKERKLWVATIGS